MINAFIETKNLFIDFLKYSHSYSYEEWLSLSSDKKAAALFVEFYDAISLAWYKTKSFYIEDEDGVSCVLQYLMKNVPIIEADRKRYNPRYIYRIAFNCMYCICHDDTRDKRRYQNEMSNIVGYGEDELDLFDTVKSGRDFDDEIEAAEFWRAVSQLSPKAQKYLNYLVDNESCRKLTKRNMNYASDPLRDVEVKVDEMEEILSQIRTKLSRFRSTFCN